MGKTIWQSLFPIFIPQQFLVNLKDKGSRRKVGSLKFIFNNLFSLNYQNIKRPTHISGQPFRKKIKLYVWFILLRLVY